MSRIGMVFWRVMVGLSFLTAYVCLAGDVGASKDPIMAAYDRIHLGWMRPTGWAMLAIGIVIGLYGFFSERSIKAQKCGRRNNRRHIKFLKSSRAL